MTTLKAFNALRPPNDRAAEISGPPYDVISTDEARAIVAANDVSFVRISRPEVNLEPGVKGDSDEVHQMGRTMLEDYVKRGLLVLDDIPVLLVYRQKWRGAVQTGIVGCASAEEYQQGLIATHEHTRADKENDRTTHINTFGAHDEPVFLMYRDDAPGAADVATAIATVTAGEPDVDFTTDDGVTHTLWVVSEDAAKGALEGGFAQMPKLYVADGHHRSAAAARVWNERGSGEAELFPVVVFPAGDLTVLDYNRVVRDLNGRNAAEYLDAVAERFSVTPVESAPQPKLHEFGMYLDGSWHLLTAKPEIIDEDDPIARLDVAILQDNLLDPLLGIDNPRTNERIAFVGGIRGSAELEKLVNSGEFAVAFQLHPTSPEEVMDVADQGEVMPPKSTWFEPKLASGLFVHPFDL